MGANPTRCEWKATTPDSSSPLQKGNRVLESIGRQEALRALLAFSDLRELIRTRLVSAGEESDRDLFETERFILDEVLQLICDRAEAITEADGIVVALADGPDLVCRAASGEIAIARGVQLNSESGLLRECMASGRIVRANDCERDARSQLDIARIVHARSTVIVPLRGQKQQLGVLQAFSTKVHAFDDHDIRSYDLFSELVLSALKPQDQDRRVGWLSDVADEVLRPRSAAAVGGDSTENARGETEIASSPAPAPDESAADQPAEAFDDNRGIDSAESSQSLPVLASFSAPASSRPGLGVVISLIIIAALFSAATWWFVQAKDTPKHGNAGGAKIGAKNPALQPVTAPPPPAAETGNGSDNLLSLEVGSKEASDSESQNKTAARVTGVRHWSSSIGSTVVIDMEDLVPYEVHRLASPERIYFDLHDTILPPELEGKVMDVGDASLTRVRIGQPIHGVTRVVLDTKDGANFSVSMESSPYRLVVELRSSERGVATNNMAPTRMAPAPSPAPSAAMPGTATAPSKSAPVSGLPSRPLPQSLASSSSSSLPLPLPTPAPPPLSSSLSPSLAKTGKFRIVLDAGHGGWDLGTVGRRGLLEKDLVLDVTERLGKLLQTRLGSEVLFTRTDDSYLPLDQRADIANQAQADLFVSIHANYSTSTSARGIETYYTNMFSAPGSKEAEKHEDGTFTKLTPVSLSIEGLREKIDESRRLAASVQHSLYTTLSANNPDIRNRGIKDAAFAVLTGTTMPSILTEISFVSSPTDEHNLQSPAYRQEVAEALYQGIARYQHSSPRAKMAQLQSSAPRGQ